jgi:hypothetical protein
MMNAIRLKFVAVALLCLAWSATKAQTTATLKADDGPVLLRYHFHANDVHNVKFVMDQKIKQTIQGQEMTITQTIGMGYRLNVLAVDDKGVATTKLTYTSVRFKTENPGGSIDYDSTQPGATAPPEAVGFAGLVDQSMGMKFGPDGQVLDVSGINDMIKSILDKSGISGDARDNLEQSLKNQIGDKMMKQMFEQVTRIYPEQPVKPGDSWSQHAAIQSGMALILDSKYTLASRSGGVSHVTVKTDCKTDPKGGEIAMGPIKVGYNLSGQQDGKIEVDEVSGWPHSMKMTQKLAGKMQMSGQQFPSGLTVPVTIDSVMTATID